jgi:hypothetical protein
MSCLSLVTPLAEAGTAEVEGTEGSMGMAFERSLRYLTATRVTFSRAKNEVKGCNHLWFAFFIGRGWGFC